MGRRDTRSPGRASPPPRCRFEARQSSSRSPITGALGHGSPSRAPAGCPGCRARPRLGPPRGGRRSPPSRRTVRRRPGLGPAPAGAVCPTPSWFRPASPSAPASVRGGRPGTSASLRSVVKWKSSRRRQSTGISWAGSAGSGIHSSGPFGPTARISIPGSQPVPLTPELPMSFSGPASARPSGRCPRRRARRARAGEGQTEGIVSRDIVACMWTHVEVVRAVDEASPPTDVELDAIADALAASNCGVRPIVRGRGALQATGVRRERRAGLRRHAGGLRSLARRPRGGHEPDDPRVESRIGADGTRARDGNVRRPGT
jgi:hypothetical protein